MGLIHGGSNHCIAKCYNKVGTSVNFRKYTRYDSHTTKLSRDDDDRFVIEHGVKQRYEILVHAAIRFGNRGATEEILRDHINNRFKANYRHTHTEYALEKKLEKAGILRSRTLKDGTKVYYATNNALAKWRALPKYWV